MFTTMGDEYGPAEHEFGPAERRHVLRILSRFTLAWLLVAGFLAVLLQGIIR